MPPMANALEGGLSSDDECEFAAVPAVRVDDIWPAGLDELGDDGVLEVVLAEDFTVTSEEVTSIAPRVETKSCRKAVTAGTCRPSRRTGCAFGSASAITLFASAAESPA